MKKIFLLFLFSFKLFASDGEIVITGSITHESCALKVISKKEIYQICDNKKVVVDEKSKDVTITPVIDKNGKEIKGLFIITKNYM